MSDDQWALIEPMLPVKPGSRPARHARRKANAVEYDIIPSYARRGVGASERIHEFKAGQSPRLLPVPIRVHRAAASDNRRRVTPTDARDAAVGSGDAKTAALTLVLAVLTAVKKTTAV